MRRTLTVAALSVASLFALGGVAQAQPPAPDQTLPPEFAPPGPAPVTDVAAAEAFTEGYVARNAARFLDQRRRNVRTIDAEARCLGHPVRADRYGCVFTLRALVIQRRGGWWNHNGPRASTPPSDRRRRHRVRTYGCLGALTVVGGASPQGIVRFVECSRVPRGDLVAPEPVA